MSHLLCAAGHVCQKPSGVVCIVKGCKEAGGTFWGIFWCPKHDKERLDRVEKALSGYVRESKVDRNKVKVDSKEKGFGLFSDVAEEQKSKGRVRK